MAERTRVADTALQQGVHVSLLSAKDAMYQSMWHSIDKSVTMYHNVWHSIDKSIITCGTAGPHVKAVQHKKMVSEVLT